MGSQLKEASSLEFQTPKQQTGTNCPQYIAFGGWGFHSRLSIVIARNLLIPTLVCLMIVQAETVSYTVLGHKLILRGDRSGFFQHHNFIPAKPYFQLKTLTQIDSRFLSA